MNIVNKTNRQLKILKESSEGDFLVLEASETPTITNAIEEVSHIDDIETRTDVTTLVNVPEMVEGTIYIVERDIKMYLLDRDDIYYPSRDIKDDEGKYLYTEYLTNIKF